MTSANSENQLPPDREPIRTSSVARFLEQAALLRSTQHAPLTIDIVTGPSGTGKTTAAPLYLAQEEQKRQPSESPCAIIDIRPQATAKQLVETITNRISTQFRSRTSHEAFQHALTALDESQVWLLVVDNADYLSREKLEMLQLLVEKTTCSLLLIGLPRLLTEIEVSPRVARRVGLSHLFPPLSEEEVIATFLPQLVLPGWVFDPQNEIDQQTGKYLWKNSYPSLRRLHTILTCASHIAQLRGSATITLETVRLAVQMTFPHDHHSDPQNEEEEE